MTPVNQTLYIYQIQTRYSPDYSPMQIQSGWPSKIWHLDFIQVCISLYLGSGSCSNRVDANNEWCCSSWNRALGFYSKGDFLTGQGERSIDSGRRSNDPKSSSALHKSRVGWSIEIYVQWMKLTITDEKSKKASDGAPRPVIPSSLGNQIFQRGVTLADE